MSELQILFDTELNVACVNKEKIIKVQPIDKDVLYKFIVGIDGIWKTIQDYSEKNECTWIPNWQGKYIVMVQAKKINSKKPFDFMTKGEVVVKELENEEDNILNIKCNDSFENKCHDNIKNIDNKSIENKYIKNVQISKDKLIIGEKININVCGFCDNLMYRFWLNAMIL